MDSSDSFVTTSCNRSSRTSLEDKIFQRQLEEAIRASKESAPSGSQNPNETLDTIILEREDEDSGPSPLRSRRNKQRIESPMTRKKRPKYLEEDSDDDFEFNPVVSKKTSLKKSKKLSEVIKSPKEKKKNNNPSVIEEGIIEIPDENYSDEDYLYLDNKISKNTLSVEEELPKLSEELKSYSISPNKIPPDDKSILNKSKKENLKSEMKSSKKSKKLVDSSDGDDYSDYSDDECIKSKPKKKRKISTDEYSDQTDEEYVIDKPKTKKNSKEITRRNKSISKKKPTPLSESSKDIKVLASTNSINTNILTPSMSYKATSQNTPTITSKPTPSSALKNTPKYTSKVTVAKQIPKWTPPAKINESSGNLSTPHKSPSLGIRVGLSRNFKTSKPLHSNVKLHP